MLKLRYILVVVLSAVLFSSCINEEYEGPDPDLPARTILVWLGGDNNLSDETGRKIEALRQGWTYTGNKCLIYQDSRDGARLLRLRGGCRTTPTPYVEIVREYGAENSASPATFARVLREVADEYPADSYGLIFFSHASGWLPAGTLQNPQKQRKHSRSIGVDDGGTGRAEMEIAEFAAAIPDGMFDFIVFETCLTAGVEVAYELRGKSDYMLASAAEIVSPGFTPVYPSALRLLCNTAVETRTALEAFGHAWMNYVATNYTGARRSATLSLIDIDETSPLAARTQAALRTRSAEAPDLSRLQHFDRPGSYGDSPALPRFFDLDEWVEEVADPDEYEAFRAQLERTVVWKAATETFMAGQNGFTVRRHSGLTTYVEQDAFPDLNQAYRRLSWSGAVYGY
ncbi:clostripain-related cysteine peptidase [Alistipes provencensis]|uniref:clostripain-related cysteine peptidase n=1 Tax=Alistipes provencensis TaxID=1816676 RepID=UPI0007EDB38A|nr:clostripain-related cysteine peptidase [Alistipes provencensis]